jgi:hypothetical protein
MRVRSLLSPRVRKGVSAGLLLTVLGAYLIVAYTSRGFPAAQVSLNDGGVWVTNQEKGRVGRFNRPIDALDADVNFPESVPDLDVLQDAGTVFTVDRGAGSLRRLDVANVAINPDGVTLPATPRVAMGGGTVAVLEATTGRLWVRSAATVDSLNIADDPPTVQVGGHADVAVGLDGTVHAVSAAAGRVTTVTGGSLDAPRVAQADLGRAVSAATVTAVGSHGVVLADGRLLLGNGDAVTLPDNAGANGGAAVLQQAGPDAADVLVATSHDLVAVPLDGGPVRILTDKGTGTPTAPVRLGSCAHAAWSGSPVYLRQCDGDAPGAQTLRELPDIEPGSPLTFRVNRDAIVLNELATGALFTFDSASTNAGNWDALRPPVKNNENQHDKPQKPKRSDKNNPPTARPDTYGARPGQAATLNVLDNDSDPDGDVLVITSVTGVPREAGRLSIIHNGQALQLITTPNWSQTIQFKYTVDDGRGGKASAQVTVGIHPSGQNSPPAALPRGSAVTVGQHGTVSYNVLADWRDADGDPLVLIDASSKTDSVRFTPDGEVVFVDQGRTVGRKTVDLLVGDGVGVAVPGRLAVTVLPAKVSAAPVANPDRVAGVAGRPLTIRPLDNDTDPNVGVPGTDVRLRLSRVPAAKLGTTVTPDWEANTVSFSANRPGSYYLDYDVTNGTAVDQGLIRVDLRAPSLSSPPVAVADHAVVRGSEPTEVDVLGNDIDLDGDVLAIQSVDVPAGVGLAVSVIDHRWLRIKSTGASEGTATLRYRVSDGTDTDDGVVEVSLLPAPTQNEPPTPHDDVVRVRAGDVVGINVLANDRDPEGEPLTLDPTVVPDKAADQDRWLVTGQAVRFRAPDRAGTAVAEYTVRDPEGKAAFARITVTVVAADAAHDQPPRPEPVETRTFAGRVVRIPIPLDGVDPDGDSVVLLGPAAAPKLGRIVGQGIDYLDYESYPASSGTDELPYRLQDTYGKRGTGIIRIGVIQPSDVDTPPVALDDVYTVEPGATVRAPVLANDSDADADPLALEPLAPLNPNLPPGTRIDGSLIVMTAGGAGSVESITYGISDGRGKRASASLTLIARDGANLPPVARDDLVTSYAVGATTVDVDVLKNDDDIDGAKDELRLESVDDTTEVVGRMLRVRLTDHPRQVPYRIRDRHDATSVAFVHVPGLGNQAPAPVASAPALALDSGASLVVNIADQVADPEGAHVRLTAAAGLSTSPVPGLSIVDGSIEAGRFTLRADPDFHGAATVVFEVTDGAGTDDPNARTATVSLPVLVRAPGDASLRFSCPPARPQAGAPAVTVDLTTCVGGLDAEAKTHLLFSAPTSVPHGVTATLSRSTRYLSVSADAEAATGVSATMRLSITQPSGRVSQAALGVEVDPAGLAVATADTVDDLASGQERVIDVVANDISPFAGQPLHVVAAWVMTGDVVVRQEPDGRSLRITAGKDFHGRATVAYRVRDVTGKPEREVVGEVTVNVVGRPAAPEAPRELAVGNGSAKLAWAAPDGNGAAISDYEVRDQNGSTHDCANPVCQLTGLNNGATYRFQVRAHNEVGWSDFGPWSADVLPDVRPGQPGSPTTQFGDQKITLQWTPPTDNGGSPVLRYEVDISPAVGAPRQTTGTSLEWDGLVNGSSYTFRVRAYNRSAKPGDWSPASAPEIPARAPDAPAAPTAAGVANGVGQQIVVQWQPPATNGAPIITYQVTVLRAGAVIGTQTVDGDLTQTTVDVTNGVDYTFRVVAVNKAGASVPSGPSVATVAHGKPFPVTSFTVSDNSGGTGYDRQVAYTATPPNDNGMAISHYELNYSGTTSADASGGASGFVGGLVNGQSYQLKIRACNDMCGDWSALSGVVVPYGPVQTPGAGAAKSGSRQILLSWSPPGTNGRPLNRVEINIDNGGWANIGLAPGTRLVGNGPNETHSIQVRAFDSAGQASAIATASATTDPPAVYLTRGTSAVGQPGCSTPDCAFIVLELVNFPSNGSWTCTFSSSIGGSGFVVRTGTVDASGHFKGQTGNYFGVPSSQGGWVQANCNGVVGRSTSW